MKARDLKAALLNKGWAGRTLSRPATVERLNPLIVAHMALNHRYNNALNQSRDPEVRAGLSGLLKTAHTDVGKIMETVFSCGAVAYNGTDMEPNQFVLPEGKELESLYRLEEEFHATVVAEQELEHQMRTVAVLNRILESSNQRLSILRQWLRQWRR